MQQIWPRIFLHGVTALGLLAAVYIGSVIGAGNAVVFVMAGAIAAFSAWLILAGKYWWLAVPFGLGVGGFFLIPFRVYPHEVALGASVAAVIPQILLQGTRIRASRPRLPIVFYALGLYLIAHFCATFIYNHGQGAGNVSRAYMNAIWPFVFGFYFWRFGSTTVLKASFLVIYGAALFRMMFGLVNYFTGTFHWIPGFNYVVDPQDLRTSGSIVLGMALLFTLMRGSALVRFANSVMVALSACAVFLGGSRTGAATLLFIPLFTLAVFRRWVMLLGATTCAVIFLIALNVYPNVLENLPFRAARAASVFLIEQKLDVQETVRSSDEWHRNALPGEAYKRWSKSPQTVLFGTGIKPFKPLLFQKGTGAEMIYNGAEIAADMGSYESSFWTILAVLGAAGVVLYVLLLGWLFVRLMPALLQRKNRDVTWAALFWACVSIAGWAVFAIPAGSYPSLEIFFGILALAALADDQNKSPQTQNIAVQRAMLPSVNAPYPSLS